MEDFNFRRDFKGFHGHGGRAGRGDLKPIILNLLSTKPMHGYEIIKTLDERSQGFWRPSAGTIYPNLQLLEEQDLIVGNDVDGKKVYSLTEKGKQEAKEAEDVMHKFSHEKFNGRHAFHDIRPEFAETMHLLRDIGSLKDKEAIDEAKKIIQEMNVKLKSLIGKNKENS